MNMRKNMQKTTVFLSPMATRLLHSGALLIFASLLRLWYEVQTAAPFAPRLAAYFGGLLEYPLAALALLTGAVLLIDRAERSESRE